MAFIAASTSFTRYRVIDPVPDSLWSEAPGLLKRFAIRDIDGSTEERSWGWVSFDDWLDIEWKGAPPEKGAYFAFGMRLDTRRVPPAVFKKHFQLAVRDAEAKARQDGRKGISRDHKRELKDQVMVKLRARTLPIPAVFSVVWSMENNTVWFDSTRDKVCEMFSELFTETFDLHLEPLTPYFLAIQAMGPEAQPKLDDIEAARFA